MRTRPAPDPYVLLGVGRDADRAELAAAFRARAKQLHPDTVDGDTERFQELTAAYRVLADPEARARLDVARAGGRSVTEPGAPTVVASPRATAPVFATYGRARAALIGGIVAIVGGLVLAAFVPALPEATKGETLGRDLTLWISAVKLVVCGAILAVVGRRRMTVLRARPAAQPSAGSS